MTETICLIITAFAAVSREIRGWIKLRKREKDDESHPPFLTPLPFGTTFYTWQNNILFRVRLPQQHSTFLVPFLAWYYCRHASAESWPRKKGACLNYLNCFPDNLLSMFSRYPNRINQVTLKKGTPFTTTKSRRKKGRIENIRTKQAGHAFACG